MSERPMTKYGRHLLVQSLVVVGGWFSLRYGWGIEVQRWWVLATYGLSLSLGLMFAQAWVMRGRDTRKTGGEG